MIEKHLTGSIFTTWNTDLSVFQILPEKHLRRHRTQFGRK